VGKYDAKTTGFGIDGEKIGCETTGCRQLSKHQIFQAVQEDDPMIFHGNSLWFFRSWFFPIFFTFFSRISIQFLFNSSMV
jgi:hypothetical protein